MEKSQTFTAKTVEEAIEEGLKELGVSREEAEIEVLAEGKVRKIGRSVPAEVRLTVREKATDGERALRFLEGLFKILGEEVTPILSDESEKIIINLQADSAKGIIGRRGEIIDALQTLAGAVANTGRKVYKRVVVDYENYREQREDTLRHVAEKLAAKAVRFGKRVRLEPMNPYDRRIIHSALMENGGVTTHSEGKEPNRYVVVTPKNMRSDRNDRNGRKGGRGGKFNDRGGKYGERKFGEKKYPRRELPAEGTPQSSGTSLHRSDSGNYKRGGFSGFFGTYLGNSRDDDGNNEE